MKSTVSVKLSLLVGSAIIITALAVNHVYMRANKDILSDAAVSDLRHETAAFKYPLERKLEEVKEDLRFLSAMRPVRGWLRAKATEDGVDPLTGIPASEWKERVAGAFEDMTFTRKHYMQIRFINTDGLEAIRFNADENGASVRVPDEQLQDKSKRDYVRNTLALPRGRIYFSAPNLNRENGVLEIPYRLTLRASIPAYSTAGVSGLIVINVDFGAVLAELRNEMRPGRLFYVTNGAGDYLLHPDKFALYAGDTGHGRRLQSDRPEILSFSEERMARGTIYVPREEENANVLSYVKYKFDADNPENFIGIALEKPYDEIMQRAQIVGKRGFIAAGFVALALAPLSVAILYALLRPLRRITRTMMRYREGDRTVSVPDLSANDEIGMLAREFAALANAYNEEDWIKEKKIEICGDLLHCRNMAEFGEKLTSTLAPTAGAQLAVLHVREDMLGENELTEPSNAYVLAGAWGFDPNERKDDPKFRRFCIGEGMAGACAAEGKMVTLNVPKNYLHVSSGLGDAHPAKLILLPIPIGKQPIAVLELATLGEFTSMRTTLLSRIAFILDLSIKQVSASMRANYLLEQAQQAAEELKAQQEELEIANKEMEEKNDELREQAAELEETQRQVNEKIAELQQSDRYKSEFLANMSHELRTPLNSMLILSESWKKNEEGNLTKEQIEEAEIVHSGGMELLNLINDILDLSKIEAGRLAAEPTEFPLARLVEKLAKQFAPVAKSRSLKFEAAIDPGTPEEIYNDRRRIDQILKNLLANAFKFTHSGEVRLSVGAKDDNKHIVFNVSDTGIGIRREKHDEIFRAFRQEDGAIDRRYGGTGLGLTIARKFARMLGGDVTVTGEKGKGSVFSLVVPARFERAGEASAAQTNDIDGESASAPLILALECDAAAPALRKIAPACGARFYNASSNDDALGCCSANTRGVAVLPATLPGGNASEWLERLEKQAPNMRAVIFADETPAESEYMALRRFTDHIVLSGEAASDEVLAEEIRGILSLTQKNKRFTAPPAGVKMRHDAHKVLSGRKILVVDDDLRNSFSLCRMLKSQDLKTIVADNGKMGLQKLEENPDVDLILTDVMMPEMDGYAFIRAVRARPEYRALPIIALTAYAMPEEQNKCMAAGANDYLSKPVDVERTLNLLRVWLFKQEEEAA